jgi:putative intracellular protease/amidase
LPTTTSTAAGPPAAAPTPSTTVTAGPVPVLPGADELAARDDRAATGPDVPTRGRVAVLTVDRVEDVESSHPYHRFVEEGCAVDVVTPAGGPPTGCEGTGPRETTALVAGRSLASWHEVAPEMTAAGGTYLDQALVEGGRFVTSREPGDVPLEVSRPLQRLRESVDRAHPGREDRS